MEDTDIMTRYVTTTDYYQPGEYERPLLSEYQAEIIQRVNYLFLAEPISWFGIVANVINMLIFYRQGLNSTTNISFFALAVSDLCCLVFQQVVSFFVIPLPEKLRPPVVHGDILHLAGGVPRAVFSRTTCLLTAYMTAERCLCVTFPLHIKQIVTPTRTKITIVIIYSIATASLFPMYGPQHLDWYFYSELNQTLLGIRISNADSGRLAIIYMVYAFSGLFSFLVVIVLTIVLMLKLKEKTLWRKTANVQQDNSGTLHSRDRTALAMVSLIASVLVLCYTPAVLISLTSFMAPEFNIGRKYNALYFALGSFAILMETINSSSNIFLYFNMSSKYRQIFYEILSCCQKGNDN